eukprot:1700394-Pleurochrysis_carterae.AAC.3
MYPCSVKGAYDALSVGSHARRSSTQALVVIWEQSQDYVRKTERAEVATSKNPNADLLDALSSGYEDEAAAMAALVRSPVSRARVCERRSTEWNA